MNGNVSSPPKKGAADWNFMHFGKRVSLHVSKLPSDGTQTEEEEDEGFKTDNLKLMIEFA